MPDQHHTPTVPPPPMTRREARAAERAAERATTPAASSRRPSPGTPERDIADARAHPESAPVAATLVALRRPPLPPAPPTPQGNDRWTRGRLVPLSAVGAVAAVALFTAVSVPAQAAAAATLPPAPRIIVQRYISAAGGASSTGRDGYTITLPARPSVATPEAPGASSGVGAAVGTSASRVGSAAAGGASGVVVNTGTGDIRWPVAGPIRISSPFGPRPAPCAICSSVHEGIDIIPGYGTPIGAVAAGTVRISGVGGDYGQYVIIDHIIDGRKISTLYAHLIFGSSPLQAGAHVTVGQLVGLVGSTGASTGAHLHLQVMLDGVTPVDPLAWLRVNAGRTL